MGPAAKAAVPALLDASRSGHLALRTAAAEALKAVDPEAATKAHGAEPPPVERQ
jgi:HEAT repeat protein